MATRNDFRAVDTNLEEIDAKIREHRRGIVRRAGLAVFCVIAVFFGSRLWMEMRSYSAYDIRNTVRRSGSDATSFATFGGNIVECSNDGIGCIDGQNEYIWNQSFEMTSPKVVIRGNYLAVYDQGGTEIYIITADGPEHKIETSKPIKTLCVAEQGTVAVLMRENDVSYIKIYDRGGTELANGEFYANKGGYPVDIALSDDARKMAVVMIDVNDGNIKSTISFYNFGSVGQNEINNNVGSFSFPDVLIPEIAYVSNNRMIALGDKEFVIFEGSQKPKIAKEIALEHELNSVFYNEKYIGTVYENENGDEEDAYHILVYDMKGSTVMENDTDIHYESIGFLANNEVCVQSREQCELFTIHSVKKFSYTFDSRLQYIAAQDRYQNYIFIFQDTIEEVRLK